MITSITGTVSEINSGKVEIITSGFGLEVFVSRAALERCVLNETVSLKTYLQVSDAGMVFFGFADSREREVFLALIQTKGVGGKTAITMLTELSAEQIIDAIMRSDSQLLASVQGIGKTTADRLCFEMPKKIAKNEILRQQPSESSSVGTNVILEGLTQLGIDRVTAVKVYQQYVAENGEPANVEDGIYGCLQRIKR